MNNLIKFIEENTSSRFKARYDEKNNLIKNIANYGSEIGNHVMMDRNGEYYGLTLEILENIKPLINDYKIMKCIDLLHNNNYILCIKILDLNDEYIIYGNKIISFVIEKWCENCLKNKVNLTIINNFIENSILEKSEILDKLVKRIKTQITEPISCKIKIIGLGKSNKNEPVVPIEWLNKIFDSGYDLHNQMNNLE